MALSPYLIFVYDLICVVLTVISIILSFYGLKHQNRILSKDVSPIITVFFYFMLIYSITWLLYVGYLIILWRPTENIYNVKIFWGVSMLRACFSYLPSVIDTFLAFDRCLVILFPTKYTKPLKKCFAYFSVATTTFTFLFVIWITATVESIPTFTSTECYYVDCLNTFIKRKNTYETKCALVGINVASGIILLLLFIFHNKSNTNKAVKRVTKTLLIIIFSSLIFDFAPVFLNQILSMYKVINQSLGLSYGPFQATLALFNNTVCIWIYYRAIKKSSVSKFSSHVVTTY